MRTLEPRVVRAGNGGPFTLDGTRTFLVGREQVALIDPGPDDETHVRALSSALEEAAEVRVLVTHAHRDHAAASYALAERLGAHVFGPPSVGARFFGGAARAEDTSDRPPPRFHILEEGDSVPTDQGDLTVLRTPGHTADHLSFRWPIARALFVGDLLLGEGSTTWLGEYAGCVGEYLSSLRRVRMCRPAVLYPAHGEPLLHPEDALDRFDAHRRRRLAQVAAAADRHPDATPEELVSLIYGRNLPEGVARAARDGVAVMLQHVRGDGV